MKILIQTNCVIYIQDDITIVFTMAFKCLLKIRTVSLGITYTAYCILGRKQTACLR